MKLNQRYSLVRIWGYVGFATILFLTTWVWISQLNRSLGMSTFASGCVLFAAMTILALFSVRKRLSFLPLAPAYQWFNIHAIGGFLVLFLFWLHMAGVEAKGFYGQTLTVLFYVSSISGVFGLVIEKVYPRQLTCIGVEVIYERIPNELSEIRENVEALILKCTEEEGSSTLAEHYLETLRWYFQKPRFFFNNIFGSHLSQHWLRQQCMILGRYLNDKERYFLDQVFLLAEKKRKIDFHYALQTMLKTWLLLHIPFAAALMAMVIWHVILVLVFFL
tara:strand:+ start:57 stop:884 length:828 start_codon:yes stop_codon:yes gene_type:complete